MRQIRNASKTLAITAIVILGFTACQKNVSNNLPPEEEFAVANPQFNGAAVTTTIIDLNLADFGGFPQFIPCANGGTGEWILSEGNIRQLSHLAINGNNYVMKFQFTPQGVIANGQTTGDLYHATGSSHVTQTGSFVNGRATFSSVWMLSVTGPGSMPNMKMIPIIHTTVNADGAITSVVENINTSCN